MRNLTPLFGSIPVGGVIPVSSGFTVTNTNYKMADGSDITSSSYPDISPQLNAATLSTLKQLPSSVNYGTVGFGNGLYIAAVRTTGAPSIVIAPHTLSYSTDGVNWVNRAIVFPDPNGYNAYHYVSQIKYLNGAWYAILTPSDQGYSPLTTGSAAGTYGGVIYKSTDGYNWTYIMYDQFLGYINTTATDNIKCNSIKYINSVYFVIPGAVTANGATDSVKIFTSSNGTSWAGRSVSNQPALPLTDIAYGAGLYVMTANQYTYSSPDYITWTARTNSSTYGWSSIAFGAGVFVTVQGYQNGTSTVAGYSTDGITWSAKTIPSGRYQRVIFANSLFVAIGYGVCATSADGITWTSRTVPNFNWTDIDYSATYGFLAVANNYNATTPNVVIQSTDGLTWTSNFVNHGLKCSTISYGTGFGFLTFDTGTSFPLTSSDGVTWTKGSTATSWVPNFCAQNSAGTTAVIAGPASNYLAYSTNLTSWTNSKTLSSQPVTALKWLNDKFVAMGYYASGTIATMGYYSADGITWASTSYDNASTMVPFVPLSMTYGGGTYVAVGIGINYMTGPGYAVTDSRTSLVSSDGIVWKSAAQLPMTGIWACVEYGNGVFVAITTRNQKHINTSGGVNSSNFWSLGSDPAADSTANSGRVCAVSTNGIDWTLAYMPFVGEWNSLSFNGHVFIAIDGQSKSYAVSKDGYNWTVRAAPDHSNWNSIVSNTSTNVSVAVSGDMPYSSLYTVNALGKYGATMRITESSTQVTLPYIRPQEGLNYAVRVI